MKLLIRSIFCLGILTISLCCIPEITQAQSFADPCGGPNDPCDPDTPIDGGLSILVAAGVGYGIKKVRDERKKNSNKL